MAGALRAIASSSPGRAALVVLAWLLSAPASAETPRLRLPLDLPVTLAAGAGWLALDLAAPGLTRTSCPCSTASLDALDRPAARWRWGPGETLAHLSLAGALGASLGVLALADEPHAWVEDLGLALESTLAAGLLTQSVKIAAARPYPFMYGGGVTPSQAANGVNYASFWSGHTAVGMATATSAARLVDARGAPLWLRVAAWSVGPLLALGAGAFMASAGNHFPTDVALGAVAGAAVGVSNVALHAQ